VFVSAYLIFYKLGPLDVLVVDLFIPVYMTSSPIYGNHCGVYVDLEPLCGDGMYLRSRAMVSYRSGGRDRGEVCKRTHGSNDEWEVSVYVVSSTVIWNHALP
jgi:hypothetical protein